MPSKAPVLSWLRRSPVHLALFSSTIAFAAPQAPVTPPSPHDIAKNRYISFTPVDPASNIAYEVTMTSSAYTGPPGVPGANALVELSGILRGGSCASDADCNDHNACTGELCIGNTCQRTNVAPGTPCGSNVDGDCTDPDECDGSGHCLTNDAANGTDCNGSDDCLGGQCGPLAGGVYAGAQLPEISYIGSEARHTEYFPMQHFVVGRVIATGSVDHAAAWKCQQTLPPSCTLTLLPEGGASTSVANGVSCSAPFACIAVGSGDAPPQPAIWSFTNPNWTAELVPLPPGHSGGSVAFAIPQYVGGGTRVAAGETIDASGFRKATYWTRSGGVWTDHLLTDYGAGRESASGDLVLCPTGVTAFCDQNELLISGWAENNSGVIQPVIWHETGVQTGTFTMTVLPLPPGALGMARDLVTADGADYLDLLVESDSLTVVGTIVLNDTSTRAAVWATENFSSWNTSVLSPLAPFENSTAVIGHRMQFDNWVLGSSFPTGGDPLLDGAATRWSVDAIELPLTVGPTDLNDYFWYMPPGCTAAGIGGHGISPEPQFVQLQLGYPLTLSCAGAPGQPHAGMVWLPPAPDNDDCANRLTLQPGLTAFNNVTAILDGPSTAPACDSGNASYWNDIWFEFVPETSDDVLFSLCDGTAFDSVLSIFGNGTPICTCPSDNIDLIDCADDTCGQSSGPSDLTISVQAGDCYLVRIGKWGSEGYGGRGTILVALTCSLDSDCNDGNECTTDTCPGGTCQYEQALAGTPCGDPTNDVCTDPDTCDGSGVCQRNDAVDGTGCTSPNVCIIGESCDNGGCRGTYNPNCCINALDCDDHNACTDDSCTGNACAHINASPGASCGSNIDGNCTNPDTCDASGNCLTNDVVDGTACGNFQCFGGECGGVTYPGAINLPQSSYIGVEPRDGIYNLDDILQIVGRVLDETDVTITTDHAAVWTCDVDGTNCVLEVLPDDGFGAVANSVACDGQGTCVIVGNHWDDPPPLTQPIAWVKTGNGPWIREDMPLPAGFIGGSAGFVDDVATGILARGGTETREQGTGGTREQGIEGEQRRGSFRTATVRERAGAMGLQTTSDAAGLDELDADERPDVLRNTPLADGRGTDASAARGTSGVTLDCDGWGVNAGGNRKAVYWTRDAQGVWSVHLLTDYGPGRESAATHLVQCDANSPAGICDAGEILIAGWAEDGLGIIRPVVWGETSAFSGQFTLHIPPLPSGAVGLVTDITTRDQGLAAITISDNEILVSGSVELADGRTRGTVWKTANFSSWGSAVLPPLPGYDNSLAGGGSSIVDTTASTTAPLWPGTSYPAGGNPLFDGVATQWTIDPDTLAPTTGPTDMNTLVSGLPAESRFSVLFAARSGPGGFAARGGHTPPKIRVGSVICSNPGACGAQLHGATAIAFDPAVGPPAPNSDPTGINKARYISFAVSPANTAANETALQVTLVSLMHPSPPNLPQFPAPNFTTFEGQVRYVGAPSNCVETESPPTTYKCASLQCAPLFMDWGTALGGQTLHVASRDLVPSSIFEVRQLALSCQGFEAGCPAMSAALTVSTQRWGDIQTPFQATGNVPLTQPAIGDIVACVDKFRALPSAIITARGDVNPATPNGLVQITDVASVVDAFKSFSYPFTGTSGPQTCP